MRRCSALAFTAVAQTAIAQAPPEPAPDDASRRSPVERIEIRGTNTDTEQRRNAIAGKIVIGREEIERQGDTTVGEVLRRLPGITLGGRPGRGGEIRMRGMGGGFTQILVDGQRMPAGLALETLSADQIERIEIFRAPTAEHGARAIAGTINIVLREPLERRLNDLRLTAGYENGYGQPQVSWTRNDVLGERATYNLSLSALRETRLDDVTMRTREVDALSGAVLDDQEETGESINRRNRVTLVSRIQWRHGPGESLTLTPFVAATESRTESPRQTAQLTGTPLPYTSAFTAADFEYSMFRLNAQEQRRIGPDSRIELRGMVSTASWRSRTVRQEFDAAQAVVRTLEESTDNTDRAWRIGAKLTAQPAAGHNLVAGVEMETTTRDQERSTLQNGAPLLADLGDEFGARTRVSAAYIQDEWEVMPGWSAHAGLRVERIDTRSESSGSTVSNSTTVWTPLLHSVWKLDPKRRDQIRASLTRSYRAPSLQDLIQRPAVSARYAPPGPNIATSPDRIGNPDLRPELATGIELAYEKYLEAGGVLSANLFHRRIADLIRNVTTLETVSYAAVPRWVVRPQNLDSARVVGLELEAKFRLDELVARAPQVSLRGNLSLYRSEVEGVPGPDNRIDRQPKATGNLGADYNLRAAPLQIGGSIHWVPAYRLQTTDTQSSITDAKRTIDLYALWTLDRNTRLRFSASNILARDFGNSSSIVTGPTIQSVANTGPTWTAWAVRLEMRL